MLLTLVFVLALVCAAPASATTFCVPDFHAACPATGTNTAQANLETAANSNASDGSPDTVIVAAGHTYTDSETLNITAAGTDPLTIAGGGPWSG